MSVATIASLFAFGAVACSSSNDNNGETATATEAMTDQTPTSQGTDVNLQLLEYQIIPDVESVPAGSVTFNASNIGGAEHEVVIIKTDLAPDALPTNNVGKVDEEGEGLETIDEIPEFEPGEDQTLTLDLDAGSYVLICNIVDVNDDGSTVSHYEEGMYVPFEVTE